MPDQPQAHPGEAQGGVIDAIGNLAVLAAAAGVFGTGSGWPNLIVAAIMAGPALPGAFTVIRQSLGEMRRPVPVPAE